MPKPEKIAPSPTLQPKLGSLESYESLSQVLGALNRGSVPDPLDAAVGVAYMRHHMAADLRKLKAKHRNNPAIEYLELLVGDIEPDKGGRGRILDDMKKEWLVGAVEAAFRLTVKRGDAFELAREFLADNGILYTLGSVERNYQKWRDEHQPRDFGLDLWISDIEDYRESKTRRKPD